MATSSSSDAVAPEYFIPPSTQDNYDQIARDAAAVNGTTPKAAMAELRQQFLRQHEQDPNAGYDHLAAWAKGRDPAASAGPSGLALAQARAVESARRDPGIALAASSQAVAAAVESMTAADAAAAASSGTSVDLATGVLPNTGLIPVTAETAPTASSSDEAAQQATPPPPAVPPTAASTAPSAADA